MSPIFESEFVIKNKSLVRNANSEIPTLSSIHHVHYFSHLSQEATEILIRLNKLANSYPFNILYRYRDNMQDFR